MQVRDNYIKEVEGGVYALQVRTCTPLARLQPSARNDGDAAVRSDQRSRAFATRRDATRGYRPRCSGCRRHVLTGGRSFPFGFFSACVPLPHSFSVPLCFSPLRLLSLPFSHVCTVIRPSDHTEYDQECTGPSSAREYCQCRMGE